MVSTPWLVRTWAAVVDQEAFWITKLRSSIFGGAQGLDAAQCELSIQFRFGVHIDRDVDEADQLRRKIYCIFEDESFNWFRNVHHVGLRVAWIVEVHSN